MRSLTSRFLGSITALVLVGCSATGPVFTPAPMPATGDQAIVNVYRPDQFMAKAASFRLFLDKKKIVTIKNNGYTRVMVSPGQHTLEVGLLGWAFGFLPGFVFFSKPLTFEVEAGERAYIHVQPAFFGVKLTENGEDQGLRQISTARYMEPKYAEL